MAMDSLERSQHPCLQQRLYQKRLRMELENLIHIILIEFLGIDLNGIEMSHRGNRQQISSDTNTTWAFIKSECIKKKNRHN